MNKILTDLQTQKYEDLSENPPDSLKIFNLWNFSKSTDALQYPGQIPSQIMENLLWYYIVGVLGWTVSEYKTFVSKGLTKQCLKKVKLERVQGLQKEI